MACIQVKHPLLGTWAAPRPTNPPDQNGNSEPYLFFEPGLSGFMCFSAFLIFSF